MTFETAWTPEAIETLKALWEKGVPAAKIASTIGGFTKSGVLGKARRLDLPMRLQGERVDLAGRKRAAPKPAKRSKSKPHFRVRHDHADAKPPYQPPPPHPDEPAPIGIVRDFTGCRWIPGEAADLDGPSCGAERVGESSWCAFHLLRVHQPSSQTARDYRRTAKGVA